MDRVANGVDMNRRLSVAPMMECTDRHDRYFLRLLSRHTLLYTEMLTTGAVLHGNRARLLAHQPQEHPVAIQLGGSEPSDLARCSRLAEDFGYDEINLNVGCPSPRVREGRFGACLMAEPQRVAECVHAMRAMVHIPVTVKTRTGVDDRDSYADLNEFVGTVAQAGCQTFVIHARKAWLKGLSPKQNREIPPLEYATVYRLKRDFPNLEIIVNGGVASLQEAAGHLEYVDGVMVGREAYRNPYVLACADERLFGDPHVVPSRHDVVRSLLPYMRTQLDRGVSLGQMTRHVLGLFQGEPGARAWRRRISERAHRPGAGIEVVESALELVPERSLDVTPMPAYSSCDSAPARSY